MTEPNNYPVVEPITLPEANVPAGEIAATLPQAPQEQPYIEPPQQAVVPEILTGADLASPTAALPVNAQPKVNGPKQDELRVGFTQDKEPVLASTLVSPMTTVSSIVPEVFEEKKTTSTKILLGIFSLLSAAEVTKSVFLGIRLIWVEFPIVESIVETGQLTEQLFFRFCLKALFIGLAAILSTYALFCPWISPGKKSSLILRKQGSLLILVLLLLAASLTLKYVGPTLN